MARVRMAQIYLEQKHDRIRFSQCYKWEFKKREYNSNLFRDILDKSPTPQAYVMLGDAFMSIQEVSYQFYHY